MALQFRDLHRPGCLGNVSGELRRGRVTAVLGPSGAGKTSFFSVLSGRLAASEGTILLNGQRTSLSEHKSLLGFVTEDDALLPLFSVEETLDFAAAVRLSAKVTPHERTQLVNRLLHVLGLSHIRHSRVGQGAALAGVRGVSFGERRRLSIGVELAGLPQILLVDDATCGLDSRTAREVVATLGRVAENGLTVAAILHQPSWPLLSRIDDVLCIGRGGYAVYCGPTAEALAYFASAGQRRRILTHPRTPQLPADPLLIPASPYSWQVSRVQSSSHRPSSCSSYSAATRTSARQERAHELMRPAQSMAAGQRRAPRASPLGRMAAAMPMLALTSCCARCRSCGASIWRGSRSRVRRCRASCGARTGRRGHCPLPAGSRASSCSSGCTRAARACSSSADGARRASSERSPRPPSPPQPDPHGLSLHDLTLHGLTPHPRCAPSPPAPP